MIVIQDKTERKNIMEKKVIVSEKSPAAIGPYSQAIEYNGIVYTSGVIGVEVARLPKDLLIEVEVTAIKG